VSQKHALCNFSSFMEHKLTSYPSLYSFPQ
jgi:hypothetical protein